MLIDSAIINVKSGRGGDGSKSMRREKYVPKGGPDGGDGGKGGDVILVADAQVATLLDFAGRHHWHAEPGQQGQGKGAYGRNGQDLEVRVPVGTLVYAADDAEQKTARRLEREQEAREEQEFEDDPLSAYFQPFEPEKQHNVIAAADKRGGELIVDLATPGQRYVIARGGKGGRGNIKFATSTNQSPRTFEPGGPAEQRQLRLELKLIADVGLVGLPNAGKSTMLSVISAAKPKIANYPFTTLEPQLGLAELPGGRRMVVADLPGLIERASEGAGLGHRFLRHIERTRLLLHVVDATGTEESTPAENYALVRRELERYSEALAGKPEVLVLNKAELVEDREVEGDPLPEAMWVSAATRHGVRELLEKCWDVLQSQTDASEGESVEQGGSSQGWSVE